jgi:hypothetical protein
MGIAPRSKEIIHIIRKQAIPPVGCEEEDVRAGRVHLVRLAWMNGLLLHRLDLQRVQLLVKHLAPVAVANTG